MSSSTPYYSVLSFIFVVALHAAPTANATAANAAATETPAGDTTVQPTAKAAVFPKINPRRNKWGLDVIEQHGRKNGWQPLPADSVRIVSQPMGFVGTGFQVDLQTAEVKVLSGAQDVPNIRSFKLQSPQLQDLKKLLESKPYRDLAEEGRAPGLDGTTTFIESDWQGEYRWRLYWVDQPYPLAEISELVRKAYQRERPQPAGG